MVLTHVHCNEIHSTNVLVDIMALTRKSCVVYKDHTSSSQVLSSLLLKTLLLSQQQNQLSSAILITVDTQSAM